MCIENKNEVEKIYSINFQSGVQVTDYSSIIQKKHLKPVELNAQKIVDQL